MNERMNAKLETLTTKPMTKKRAIAVNPATIDLFLESKYPKALSLSYQAKVEFILELIQDMELELSIFTQTYGRIDILKEPEEKQVTVF